MNVINTARRSILPTLLFLLIGTVAMAQPEVRFDLSLGPVTQVNGPANDYAPVLSQDGGTLYLTSYREEDSRGEADLFFSSSFTSGWSAARNVGAKINTLNNEGAFAIAGDGRTVVFAADGRPDSHGETDLYIGFLENNNILRVENLGSGVNSSGWDSQPSISPDGRTVFFASDRSGGEGGIDLYVTRLGSTGWSAAVNLGPIVNSGSRELSPSVSRDGNTLYFGSDRDGGIGGIDLWATVRENGRWTAPVNLGRQLNSDEDDLFLHLPQVGGNFYFATSRRPGAGGFDVWSGSPNIFDAGMFRASIRAIDSLSGTPVAAEIRVTDVASGQTVATFSTDASTEPLEILLPAGRQYRLTGIRDGELPAFAGIERPRDGSAENVLLEFGKEELVMFDLGRFDIPFFVSGYYRPNTLDNLEELFELRRGVLREATYIEDLSLGSPAHQQYIAYGRRIDSILNGMVRQTVDIIAPAIFEHGGTAENLEVVVTGFVDPDQFVGTYLESENVNVVTSTGRQISLKQGDPISNLELSGLRAYYSQKEIDRILSATSQAGNRAFLDLKNSGRITYRIVAGGVSGDSENYAEQRRIHVRIVRKR